MLCVLAVESDESRIRVSVMDGREPVFEGESDRCIEIFLHLVFGPLRCGDEVHRFIHEDT